MENAQSPRLEVFKGLLFGIGNLVVLYIKILTICGIRKNNGAGWLLLAFLHKLTTDKKNKFMDKINQLLVSQDAEAEEKNRI